MEDIEQGNVPQKHFAHHPREFREAAGKPRLPLDPQKEQVADHRHPHLRENGVLARAQERPDLQMLLDPLEEELDMPAMSVDICNGFCGELRIVREELVDNIMFHIAVGHESQIFWIVLDGIRQDEGDAFIFENTLSHGRSMFSEAHNLRILFETNDEGDLRFLHIVEKSVIHISPVNGEDAALRQGGESSMLFRRPDV